MKRILTALLAIALAACNTRHPEDATAYYARPEGIAFTVQTANGDVLVTAGDQATLRKDGIEYLVRGDARGRYAARIDDYLAVIDAASGAVDVPRAQPDYAMTADGRAVVAGLPGTLWRLHPRDTPSLPAIEAVVSDDPALAVLGAGVAMHVRLLIERNARSMGGPPGKLEAAMIALAGKGMVLRFGEVFALERLEKGALPADTFALPPVLDRAALKARLTGDARAVVAPRP